MGKKKITYDLYGKLQLAQIEREVEDAWNGGISLFFADSLIEHPFECDGFLTEGLLLRLVIEYKYDEKLSSTVSRARVLVQVLFYLKRFEEGGLPLPNVIMVADRNECFVIHVNEIQRYLDEKVEWSGAPSSAAANNPELVKKLVANEEIRPFIFKVERDFDLSLVVDRIRDLAVNVKRYIRVTEHNIAQIFEYYTNNVLKESGKLEPHQLVESFIGVLLEPDEYYLHPRKRNTLVTKFGQVPVFQDAYLSFFDFYSQSYSPREKLKFTEIADRLVEDVIRRRQGEFFTPTPFVDYAHRMLSNCLGDDWKDKYVVWDCCCGTKNLTRDYRFRELYCSTLMESDLRLSERYNQEANDFVFDFLNDDTEKLPDGLRKAFVENKPVCFILNPPYARNSGDNNVGTSDSVCFTQVRTLMNADNMGVCVSNLYAQFLYRIISLKREYDLKDVCVGVFCPTLYLTGESWKHFRDLFLDNYVFKKACTFKASYFADVKPSWGIAFSVWKSGMSEERNCFPHTLVELEKGLVVEKGLHNVYNVDHLKTASVWLREETKGLKTYDSVELTSAIRVRVTPGARRGRLVKDALGYFQCESNNVDKNGMSISLFSTAFSHNVGTSVISANLFKCVTLFSARKLIEKNWINSKDEYLAPDETHVKWGEFCLDSLVYSLFHSSSNQSSLRNVEYEGKLWNVKNEFFWLPRTSILQLANNNNNTVCFDDARTDTDRYVYQVLNGKILSPEALAVLRKANQIVDLTFGYRSLFDEEHPEYQINNWDCGWYQIKAVAKQYCMKEYDEFIVLYKKLGEKMRPMVYELGFLLK